MTAWSHLPTIFKQRYVLRIVGLLTLCVALITTQLFAIPAHAAPGVNQTLSFQGRLLSAAGGIVPDGNYNMQFKIYQDGSGTAAGNPGGSLKWTETHINNGSGAGIVVKNGYFSVALGSDNAFGNQVDWNQDTLWLSMNVAGSANNCTTFNTSPCVADGEMLPMKRLTSTPFAINSAQLGGKTAENFVQIAQGVQNDASNNTSSIHLNKTGSGGNFAQFQNAGANVLTIQNSGDIEFGNTSNHVIRVGGSAANEAGRDLTLHAGWGGSGSGANGGNIFIQGGGAGGDNADGGNVHITAGAGNGTGKAGSLYIGTYATDAIELGGTSTSSIAIGSTSSGTTNITLGTGAGATGGSTRIQSKDSTTIATNGVDRATFDTNGNLILGNGVSSNTPSDFRIQGTASSASGVSGGSLTIQGGNATTGNANGGNLILSGGDKSGSGSKGMVVIDTPAYTMANTQSSSTDVNVTQSNIDSFGIVTLNATGAGVDFTVGAPSLGANAAGRILYVTAANGSQDFMLRANTGGGQSVEKAIPMQQNTTASLIWNGSIWTVVGSAGSSTLQSTYDNTTQVAAPSELYIGNNTNAGGNGGLTIQESYSSPLSDTLFEVRSASSGSLLTVSSNINEYAANGGAEAAGSSSIAFPSGTWTNVSGATITRYTAGTSNIATGGASVKVTTADGYQGAFNQLKSTLQPNAFYNVSLKAKLDSGTMNDFGIVYSPDSVAIQACVENYTITTTGWTTITCTFQAPSSGMTSENGIIVGPTGSTPRTFYIDDLSVTLANTSSLATDGNVDDAVNFSTNWASTGTGSTVTRNTSDGQGGSTSAQATITTGGTQRGVANKLSDSVRADKRYRVSAYVKQTAGTSFTDFAIRYSPNTSSNFTECADYNTQTVTNSWTQITCTISTGAVSPTNPYIYFVASSSANRTFLVDSLSLTLTGNTTANVQVGGQANDDTTTLFSLDKSSAAPAGGNDAMLGSMYYDTTLGKVQCFEADGWGACGAAPDTFISLAPEYAGAVMNGTANGTMTSDFCSSTLNINDGTSAQPSICGTNETYNLYKWTSAEGSAQAKSIYVTHQLPTNFKKFVDNSTSLLGRTDSSNSSVTYQIYRKDGTGLTACGTSPIVSVSTGAQTAWQKGTASGDIDPALCDFKAGDSIVFKISMSAHSNANAYVSNINFTYSNN